VEGAPPPPIPAKPAKGGGGGKAEPLWNTNHTYENDVPLVRRGNTAEWQTFKV